MDEPVTHRPISTAFMTKKSILVFVIFYGLLILNFMKGNLSNADLSNRVLRLSDSSRMCFYFYSMTYAISTVLGAIYTRRISSKRVIAVAVTGASLLHMLLPLAIANGAALVVIVNILKGLLEGPIFPALYGIWRYWAPPLENTTFVALSLFGMYIGQHCGIMTAMLMIIDWPAFFYVSGILGLAWTALWIWLIYDRPTCHPSITQLELDFIETRIADNVKIPIRNIPWNKMGKSMPFYAILVASFSFNWSLHIVISGVPLIFLKIYGIDPQLVISRPRLVMVMAIATLIAGVIIDQLRQRTTVTTTRLRTLTTSGGLIGCGLGLLFVGCSYPNNVHFHTACYYVMSIIAGITMTGFMVNSLDIAPRYAGILIGLSGGIGEISAVISGLVFKGFSSIFSEVATDQLAFHSFGLEFGFAIAINTLGGIFYGVFASGESQSWADVSDEETDKVAPTEMHHTPISGMIGNVQKAIHSGLDAVWGRMSHLYGIVARRK